MIRKEEKVVSDQSQYAEEKGISHSSLGNGKSQSVSSGHVLNLLIDSLKWADCTPDKLFLFSSVI
jgi:hypothetical protein